MESPEIISSIEPKTHWENKQINQAMIFRDVNHYGIPPEAVVMNTYKNMLNSFSESVFEFLASTQVPESMKVHLKIMFIKQEEDEDASV